MRNGKAAELADAAEAFGRLAAQIPDDAEAWFNRALCLAWAGLDRQAIECLDQVTGLEADNDPKKAVEAWTLAEILRQAGGAESLSDDLRYACTFAWSAEQTASLRTSFPEIRQIPTRAIPRAPRRRLGTSRCWSGSIVPFRQPRQSLARATSRVCWPRFTSRRLQSGSPVRGSRRSSWPRRSCGGCWGPRSSRWNAWPPPCPSPSWTPMSGPPGYLQDSIATLPTDWRGKRSNPITRTSGFTGPARAWTDSPRWPRPRMRRGDAVARAKLEAVVQVREQLGSRSSAIAMYQGYPFDRLRRRLGLDLVHPDAVDIQDLSCAGPAELQDQNAHDLDDVRLVEAFKSAAGLREDELTTRFAAELARRQPDQLSQLDLSAVYAPLIRQSMQRENPQEALDWLEQARTLGSDSCRRTFDTWRAEILSRTGRPDLASRIYDELVSSSASSSPQVALDAAETLLDNGHLEQARDFLGRALNLARSARVPWVEDMANHHLKTLSRKHD